LLDGSVFRNNLNKADVGRLFHAKVEVELSFIFNFNGFASLFINVNVSEINGMLGCGIERGGLVLKENSMMEDISNTLDIKRDWPAFSLYVAAQVIVIGRFYLRCESDFDGNVLK
jgi:hypothetical protein